PYIRMVLVHSQSDQVFAFSFRLLSVMPYTIPKAVSEPLVERLQFCGDTCESIIVYPSPPDFRHLFQPFLEAVESGFLGDLLEFTPERFPASLLHHQLVLSFDPFLIDRNKYMSQQFEGG